MDPYSHRHALASSYVGALDGLDGLDSFLSAVASDPLDCLQEQSLQSLDIGSEISRDFFSSFAPDSSTSSTKTPISAVHEEGEASSSGFSSQHVLHRSSSYNLSHSAFSHHNFENHNYLHNNHMSVDNINSYFGDVVSSVDSPAATAHLMLACSRSELTVIIDPSLNDSSTSFDTQVDSAYMLNNFNCDGQCSVDGEDDDDDDMDALVADTDLEFSRRVPTVEQAAVVDAMTKVNHNMNHSFPINYEIGHSPPLSASTGTPTSTGSLYSQNSTRSPPPDSFATNCHQQQTKSTVSVSNSKSSVLMNLLISGSDAGAGYSRALPRKW